VSISPSSLCPTATGQFLWEVDAGLPAEQAGMKEGDRLLAVNGESIEGLDHQQTVLKIRAHDDRVTLLVIDPAGDEFYQSVGFGDLAWSCPGWDPCGAARLDDRMGVLPPGLQSEVLSGGPGLPWSTSSCAAVSLLLFQIGLSPLLFFEDSDSASGSHTPSLPSPSGSPGLCHTEVGRKGPGFWLVAAANSIGITQVTPLAWPLLQCCSQPSTALSPGTLLPCLS